MNQEKIGKFIASCRKMQNLTQEELANKLGITSKAVSKWECGKSLPDVSIMLELCKILNITVNDLLCGEKVKEKEYQEKFEENIVNTIDYSNRKVKRIKSICLFIVIFISSILLILFVLFGIDIIRMRNNEPVFFSTWGFKYAPPINIDGINIEKVIKEYLTQEDEKINIYENEKSFVAMRTDLITENATNKYYVYAWVLQEKYILENGEVLRNSSSSIPYKFELLKENDKLIVNDYEFPRDGSYYVKDMKHIFPNSVLKDMNNIRNDGTIEKLTVELQNDVNLYFHN